MDTQAPSQYEDLIRIIHDDFDTLSRSYKLIARFVTQNPNDVAMLSVGAIAKRCNVHASSLVRFAQHFGYDGFKGLQQIFHARLANAAPGFDARVKAISDELELHSEGGLKSFLGALVARDITSLQDLLADIEEADMVTAVDLLDEADTIYVAGQLRSASVALFLRYVLTMLGRKVCLLDANGGLATEMARVMTDRDMLLAVSFRYYAKEIVSMTESAHAAGVPIVAITDSSLSPLARSASVLFAIPEDEYSFSRSLAAPMCLAQALMIALASRREGDPQPRIPLATELNRT